MSILFRVIFISMFSFAYSDCVDLDQTACEAAADCAWHAHEGETPVCEDLVHCDDLDTQAACDAEEDCDWHGDHCDAVVHCEDLNETECGLASDCSWHVHDGEAECEDLVHCDDLDTQAACDAEEDCDWHVHDGEAECEDAHGDTDCSQTDHFDGQGFALEHDETEVYSQLQGSIQGSLEVEVNNTKELAIHFLDANGAEIEIAESLLDCYPLVFNVTDASIISVEMESDDHDDHDHGDDDHEEHMGFDLTGMAVGTTTFTISIWHQGHSDYTSLPVLVTVTEEICPLMGDLNNTGFVNVADVVYLVNYILGATTLDVTCADMNGDGSINVSDVISLINIIISDRVYTDVDALESKLIISENSLTLESDGFVQGVQMTLSHNSDFKINLSDAYISEYKTIGNTTNLMLVSDKSHSITDIATFNGDIKVESIHVANQSGDVMVEQVIELTSINVNVVGPNPFNPSTQLSIAMPESGFLSVSVYNLLGQKVATLVDNYMEANTAGHIINFNAGNLASGVYIVQAITANDIASQKIMLMK